MGGDEASEGPPPEPRFRWRSEDSLELVLDAQDEARQVLAFVAIETGRGLVEQQNGGLERERAGKADELLNAEGQAATGAWR